MNSLPVYMSNTSAPNGENSGDSPRRDGGSGSSAFHPLSFSQSNYYTPTVSNTGFHPAPSTSSYMDGEKYQLTVPTTMITVVDSVEGPSQGVVRQMHHMQAATDGNEPAESMSQFMDTYFVDVGTTGQEEEVLIEEMDHGVMGLNELHKQRLFEMEEEKRMRHAEQSRLRYHRLSNDQKREVNQRRADRIKKQRQRDKELTELEDILRTTNDIEEEPALQREIRARRTRQKRADAARSRYHRMTEEERRIYNQRRRLRQLGLDPDGPPKEDPDRVRQRIQDMNAKKAAAARQRYHAMSPEERREYNARRTAAFKRRRVEEEILLSTPAGRISADALQKAQKIMIRNAKKAESARLRYQRMSVNDRRHYNQRRASAKRHREGRGTMSMTPGEHDNMSLASHDISISDEPLSPGGMNASNLSLIDMVSIDPMTRNDNDKKNLPTMMQQSPQTPSTSQQSNNSLPQPSPLPVKEVVSSSQPSQPLPPNETLAAMEREVEERTKMAHMQLNRRLLSSSSHQSMSSLPSGITVQSGTRFVVQEPMIVLVTTEQVVDNTGKETIYLQPASPMINEKQLQIMLQTGRDEQGRPVEIRTVDGQVITPAPTVVREESIHLEPIDPKYGLGELEHLYGNEIVVEDSGRVMGGEDMMCNHHVKVEVAKQRRAQKARQRYHAMTEEERSQFNSKRAEALRKARRRDEELVQMSERTPLNQMDDDTKRAVVDAQRRRSRRAELARQKYHRMNSEERRQYNAMRDAQRRQRKREVERHGIKGERDRDIRNEDSCSPDRGSQQGDSNQAIVFSGYDMYSPDGF